MSAKKNNVQNFETDLGSIIRSFWQRKYFLLLISLFFAVGGYIFANYVGSYSNTLSFNKSPMPNVESEINVKDVFETTNEEIFMHFYQIISNKNFQYKSLMSSDLGTKLSKGLIKTEEIELKLRSFVNKNIQDTSDYIQQKNSKNEFNMPISFSVTGSDYVLQAQYLLDLFREAKLELKKNLISLRNQRILNVLESLKVDKESRIKSNLEQLKIRIEDLESLVNIAKKAGAFDNNFSMAPSVSSTTTSTATQNKTITTSSNIPKWYIYGYDALNLELEALKSKKYSGLVGINSSEEKIFFLEQILKKDINLDDYDLVELTRSPVEIESNSKSKIYFILSGIIGLFLGLIFISLQNVMKGSWN